MRRARWTALFVVPLSSCFFFSAPAGVRAVQNRAPFDLNCPEESVKVFDLGAEQYGASGCNKKVTYLYENKVAKMNSAIIE